MSEQEKTKEQLIEELRAMRERAQELLCVSAAMNACVEGVILVDLEGRVMDVNEAVLRKHGLSRKEDIVGKHSLEFVVREDRERVASALEELKRNGRIERLEYRIFAGDGSLVPVEASGVVMNDCDGNAAGFVIVVRDVSERKRAEEALRESEQNFRTLAQRAFDSIVILLGDGRFAYANERAVELTGYSVEALLGMTLKDVVPSEEYEEAAMRLRERLDGKPLLQQYEMLVITKSGERRLAEISASRTTWRGQPADLVIARDVTERRRAEDESRTLARLGTRLAATASVGEMVTVVREETDRLFKWDAHYFAVRRPGEDTFCVISFVDMIDGRKVTFPKEDWPCANVSAALQPVLEGRPVLINRKPGDETPALSRFGNKERLSASLVHVPVRGAGEVIGILSVQSYTRRRYCESDVLSLQQIADALSPALQRVYAEEALLETEEQFKSLFENIPIGLYRTTPDGRVLMANPAMVRMLGYPSFEKLAERNLENSGFEPGYPRPVFKERIEKEGQVVGLVSAWTRQDGKVVYVRESARAVRGDEGRTLYYEGAAEDVTARRLAQQKLDEMFEQIKKSHGDLLSILNMLRLAVVMVDEDGCVTFLNRAAQGLMGQSQKAVLGRRWERFFSFKVHDKAWPEELSKRLSAAEERFQARVEFPGERGYWMDVEVLDDPRNPKRKIFFLYDMSEVHDLRRMLEKKAQFHDLVGKSKPMQLVYQRIQEVSGVDWTVLIEGETGTGKELVARAIHYSSHRKDKPFIAVNCAGLTDSLLASQLFGHKRGSFTGAIEDHEGLFQVAHGGTLLLDEIGDISKDMQRSLLRVLEEKEITRLGDSKAKKIDVRILASTHRDLSEEAQKGNFRPDLLYRIRVARIDLPPLRERREDIPLLAASFLNQSRAATGKPVETISDDATGILLEYDWPGNVRELKSAIDVATLHCRGPVLCPEDLPPEIARSTRSGAGAWPTELDDKGRIIEALARTHGRRTEAASLLGISRATLYRRLAKFGIAATEA